MHCQTQYAGKSVVCRDAAAQLGSSGPTHYVVGPQFLTSSESQLDHRLKKVWRARPCARGSRFHRYQSPSRSRPARCPGTLEQLREVSEILRCRETRLANNLHELERAREKLLLMKSGIQLR